LGSNVVDNAAQVGIDHSTTIDVTKVQ
jgi:hypothetical protein